MGLRISMVVNNASLGGVPDEFPALPPLPPLSGFERRTAASSYTSDFEAVTVAGDPSHFWAVGRFQSSPIINSQSSPGGAMWSVLETHPSFTGNILGATYGRDLYVLCGTSGEIQTSPDGVTFTRRTQAGFNDIRRMINANGVFVGPSDGGNVFISGNGTAWQKIAVGGLIWEGAAYRENPSDIYLVCGSSGNISTSVNATVWTSRTAAGGYSGTFYGAAYGAGLFVIIGDTGEIQTSPDGITWTQQTADAGYNGRFRSVIYTGSRFIAVGASAEIQISDNGISWEHVDGAPGYTAEFRDLAALGSMLVIVGEDAEIQTALLG